MTTLVGGVSQLYQGDLDLGRVAVERLAARDLGPGVFAEELHYGAVAVAQRLEELSPDSLVLVGAAPRGREPGTVQRRRIRELQLDADDVQRAVADAVTGHVTLDLVVEVAWGLGVLPARTVAIEVEPTPVTGPSQVLSPPARAGLVCACDLVRTEVRRGPLLKAADELRTRLAEHPLEPTPATEAMRRLLSELEMLDDEGRWGATFRLRDRIRGAIASGETAEAMGHIDWVLWWSLIEELDRREKAEAVDGWS